MGPSREPTVHEPTTHDLLAERRARRGESDDTPLGRHAEAAEAATWGLEEQLVALEQRLGEVERERERIAERLTERELELRSVKQREYAEQQLRVEVESRGERLERELRSHVDELQRRLTDTERRSGELSTELEAVRHELSEAHQAIRLNERVRTHELEHVHARDGRLASIVRELVKLMAVLRATFSRELGALRDELARQAAWEREVYTRELRAIGSQVDTLRGELTGAMAEMRAHVPGNPGRVIDPQVCISDERALGSLRGTSQGDPNESEAFARREMAEALAAAVERLRARVAEVQPGGGAEQAPTHVPVTVAPAPEGESIFPAEPQSSGSVPSVSGQAPEPQLTLGQAPAPTLERASAPEPQPTVGQAPAPQPQAADTSGLTDQPAGAAPEGPAEASVVSAARKMSLFARWRAARRRQSPR